MSLVSWLTPWNPATIAIAPSSSALSIRPGVTSMILALPWVLSVITPAWLPVNDRASWPRFPTAMASSAIEIRSPAVSSMSSSRGAGRGETSLARSISSSVVSPIAETTTTTSLPDRLASAIRWATRLIPAASATDDPPYFCTTIPTVLPRVSGMVRGSSIASGRRGLPSRVRGCGHGEPDESSIRFASATCSTSKPYSASSRSWATIDCSARSALLASAPQDEM